MAHKYEKIWAAFREANEALAGVPGCTDLVEDIKAKSKDGTAVAALGYHVDLLAKLSTVYRIAKDRKQGDDADRIALAIYHVASLGLDLPLRPAITEMV